MGLIVAYLYGIKPFVILSESSSVLLTKYVSNILLNSSNNTRAIITGVTNDCPIVALTLPTSLYEKRSKRICFLLLQNQTS